MKYYVYMAKKDNLPIYIGKGTKNRHKHCYKKFEGCEVEILEFFEDADKAFEREMQLIKFYGREDLNEGTLLNRSNGGRYIKGSVPWKNKNLSEEHKNSISSGIKKFYEKNPVDPCDRMGEKNNFFGKKHTVSAKMKISKSKIGKESAFKGRKHTKSAKEKCRLSHLGKPSAKKIIFDMELINTLRFEKKYTVKELCSHFNCSAFPIKKALRELRENI